MQWEWEWIWIHVFPACAYGFLFNHSIEDVCGGDWCLANVWTLHFLIGWRVLNYLIGVPKQERNVPPKTGWKHDLKWVTGIVYAALICSYYKIAICELFLQQSWRWVPCGSFKSRMYICIYIFRGKMNTIANFLLYDSLSRWFVIVFISFCFKRERTKVMSILPYHGQTTYVDMNVGKGKSNQT